MNKTKIPIFMTSSSVLVQTHLAKQAQSALLALFVVVFGFLVSACNPGVKPSPQSVDHPALTETIPPATAIPSPTPKPPRQLTICMPAEPGSLFPYGDSSQAAMILQQAINDDPFEWRNGLLTPVILKKIPSLAGGDVSLAPVQVSPNDVIIDSQGNLTNLVEGVLYLPSGCTTQACAQSYTGQEPVSMDQMVVRFQIRPDLLWSDGAPLTADDSVYSYEVAQALSPRPRAEQLALTYSYQALDPTVLEWRSVPGLSDSQAASYFFSPIPRHAWGAIDPSQLSTDAQIARSPLGWGPYQVSAWQAGENIVLERNPNYFRAGEGLPHFDTLVFRFLPEADQALAALQAGDCDLLDPAYNLAPSDPRVKPIQEAGQAAVLEIPGQSWENITFGINSAVNDPTRPPYFLSKEVRQAAAQCIDRQALADEFSPGQAVLDSYVLPGHPLYNPDVKQYPYDPAAANALLQASGWLDTDNNPATPRLSLGAPGIPDGTLFTATMFTSDDPDRLRLAQAIQGYLTECGIQVQISSGPDAQVFAPGPQGAVFGRQFSLAQFGWPVTSIPSCALYSTREIPGPYPQYPRGWGGANAGGYSSPQFDQACQAAQNALPGAPEIVQAHQQAQAIFAEELPALPLFARSRWVVTRPDFCNLQTDSLNTNIFWNLENFDYGEACP